LKTPGACWAAAEKLNPELGCCGLGACWGWPPGLEPPKLKGPACGGAALEPPAPPPAPPKLKGAPLFGAAGFEGVPKAKGWLAGLVLPAPAPVEPPKANGEGAAPAAAPAAPVVAAAADLPNTKGLPVEAAVVTAAPPKVELGLLVAVFEPKEKLGAATGAAPAPPKEGVG